MVYLNPVYFHGLYFILFLTECKRNNVPKFDLPFGRSGIQMGILHAKLSSSLPNYSPSGHRQGKIIDSLSSWESYKLTLLTYPCCLRVLSYSKYCKYCTVYEDIDICTMAEFTRVWYSVQTVLWLQTFANANEIYCPNKIKHTKMANAHPKLCCRNLQARLRILYIPDGHVIAKSYCLDRFPCRLAEFDRFSYEWPSLRNGFYYDWPAS